MEILVIEDEKAIREVEVAYLRKYGYTVIEAADGQQALEIFHLKKVNAIVLDINLPVLDGIEVCKQIRSTSLVPIIMVTARNSDIDEILGFELGIDDYIKKPFNPDILVARVNNILRRYADKPMTIKGLVIDPSTFTVTKDGKLLPLTTTQFHILYFLAKNPGVVFTRDEIIEKAYIDHDLHDIYDRTIDAHIKSIRKTIMDNPASPIYIETIIGKGYRFIQYI